MLHFLHQLQVIWFSQYIKKSHLKRKIKSIVHSNCPKKGSTGPVDIMMFSYLCIYFYITMSKYLNWSLIVIPINENMGQISL